MHTSTDLDRCTRCNACIAACPEGAIGLDYQIDLARCASHRTSCFVGNASGWAALRGRDDRAGDGAAWVDLLARRRLQPDTRHRFLVDDSAEVTHVRLDVYPDGGMARVRLWGELSTAGREALAARWTALGGPLTGP